MLNLREALDRLNSGTVFTLLQCDPSARLAPITVVRRLKNDIMSQVFYSSDEYDAIALAGHHGIGAVRVTTLRAELVGERSIIWRIYTVKKAFTEGYRFPPAGATHCYVMNSGAVVWVRKVWRAEKTWYRQEWMYAAVLRVARWMES